MNQINQYITNVRIIAWYGSTESGLISSHHPQDSNGNGSRFIHGLTIKIVREDGNGCGPNESGE